MGPQCLAQDDLARGAHLIDLEILSIITAQMHCLVKMKSPSHGGLDILVAHTVIISLMLRISLHMDPQFCSLINILLDITVHRQCIISI